MASSKKVLTIFGATGNQGGSIISIALARPELTSKYTFRAITRNTGSAKAQALAAKGVELAQADLEQPSSLHAAIQGSHGVYGVTDFWALMSKEKEIAQGKAIFDAAKAAGVKHFVWSALPSVSKLSGGKYTGVAHFDSKADVKDYIEANKPAGMWVSYCMPAMFADATRGMINAPQGSPALALPWPSDHVDWPLLSASTDTGAWVLGLFEGGADADGVSVNAVSGWTTPRKVVDAVTKAAARDVAFVPVSGEAFASFLPPAISQELTDMMLWMGEFGYYGPGAKEHQAESDKWLLKGVELNDWDTYTRKSGPWKW